MCILNICWYLFKISLHTFFTMFTFLIEGNRYDINRNIWLFGIQKNYVLMCLNVLTWIQNQSSPIYDGLNVTRFEFIPHLSLHLAEITFFTL